MRVRAAYFSKAVRRPHRHNQRGVSLIATLLLLLLLTAMSLTMVLSVSSDMLINGYYRNYRGAFYAADSGLNIARQAMVNDVMATVPGVFASAVQPIPLATTASVPVAITAAYGQVTRLNGGQSATSWPEKFQILNPVLNLVSCTITGGTGGPCTAPTQTQANPITQYKYIYSYALTSIGQSQGTESTSLIDNGTLTFTAVITPAGPVNVNFAAWGMFIDQFPLCGGGTLVPGTITGPVFTNGAWNFSNSGTYTFTDPVGQVNAQSGYNNGTCTPAAGPTGSGISPKFNAGFTQGAAAVPLPQNSFSQKRAVLDSMGVNNAAVTNTDLNAALRNVTNTPYPVAGAASGVYLPYGPDPVTGLPVFKGGGIYVQGDATITLSPSGAAGQIYSIVQGGVTTTITVNPVTNTTVITSGASTKTITGVPEMKNSTGLITGPATMLYVQGNITALSGPGVGLPAIQDHNALTITAASNVTITGDVLYKTEPVTFTANQIPLTPADTLIPGNDNGQVLGIFTATGNVQLNNKQSTGNLEIDASVATISQSGSGGIVNTGTAIKTLNIVGGRIQNTIQNINATTRNVLFDRRFSQNNFAPPWFPSTTVTKNGQESAVMTPSVQRTQWLNQTS